MIEQQKIPREAGSAFFRHQQIVQAALRILPDLMQFVQTHTRRTLPSTTARTRLRFGRNLRGVLLCAWLTLLPAIGFFPQISQTLAIQNSVFERKKVS
jgi:hypothetical protein